MTLAVKEAIARGFDWCATFEVSGDPTRWLQFSVATINAAYPHAEAPRRCLRGLAPFVVEMWEPNKFVTLGLEIEDAEAIAHWIDRYFTEVLHSDWDYCVDVRLEFLG